jgi:simple sugar transport system permease protein
VSETVQRNTGVAGGPPDGQRRGNGLSAHLSGASQLFIRQREGTVFVVVVLLVIYFGFISSASSAFFTKLDIINISQIAAPIAIIAIGEVLLLICGEIDLSAGFTYAFAPFLMHYLIDFYGVPAVPAILLALLMGVIVGWVNGFFTVTMGLPSFITTFGTAFILYGLVLYTSRAEPVSPVSPPAQGIGHWIGTYAWAEITWTIIFVVIFHIVLTRTRWGLHTIATGGNRLAASEAGIKVSRIKYGNFMITGFLAAFVGVMVAFQLNDIDPSAGGFNAMFYAVTAAVIGGTAMLGGSGTILGAFLGALVLAVLTDGFDVMGISANVVYVILGAAILLAMVANVQLARLRAAGRA